MSVTTQHAPRRHEPGLVRPDVWIHQLVSAYLQVQAGQRSPMHLAPWVATPIWQTMLRTPATGQVTKPTVRVSRLTAPVPGVIEAVAMIDDGTRMRAVAVRLEAATRVTTGYGGPVGPRYRPNKRDGVTLPNSADRWQATALTVL
jgi:hypothetical protein